MGANHTAVVAWSRTVSIAALQADAGQDVVTPAGEQAQHPAGIGSVDGLAEHHTLHHHGGVGAQNGLIRSGGRRDGFSFGDPAHVVLRRFSRKRRLVHGSHTHREGNSRLPQNLAAAR